MEYMRQISVISVEYRLIEAICALWPKWGKIMGNFIDLKAADGRRLGAYSVGGPGQPRGLILCHGHGGLNVHIRQQADRMAALGFCVVAPALFDRAQPGLEFTCSARDRARARAVAANIPAEQSILDVSAAKAVLGHRSMGILGFGFGATVAWQAVSTVPGFHVAVCFYGGALANSREYIPLCPVQLHFGEFDDQIPTTPVGGSRQTDAPVSIEFYSGVGHGFACGELENFNPRAAEAAHDNSLAFLRRHMGNAPRLNCGAPANGPAAVKPRAAQIWRGPERRVAFGRRAFA